MDDWRLFERPKGKVDVADIYMYNVHTVVIHVIATALE